MNLARLFLGRVFSLLPTLLMLSLVAFLLIRLVPGDPVTVMLGERGGSPEAVAQLRANLRLDRSLPEQYLAFIGQALKGDLGESLLSKRSVWREFIDRFPATAELSLVALFWATLLGIPLGAWAAVRRNSWVDQSVMGISLLGYSMPIFWWGLILILTFSIYLGWTPVAGRMSLAYDVEPVSGFLLLDVWLRGYGWAGFVEALRHLALPALALGTVPLAAIARMTRASLLEVLNEDYMRTARAKGLSPFRVIAVHGLRNALIPIVTVIGLMGSTLLTGAILTETIFAWPGMGRWLVQSVLARDYPVIQGGLLLIGLIVIGVNATVDFLYLLINPLLRSRNG